MRQSDGKQVFPAPAPWCFTRDKFRQIALASQHFCWIEGRHRFSLNRHKIVHAFSTFQTNLCEFPSELKQIRTENSGFLMFLDHKNFVLFIFLDHLIEISERPASRKLLDCNTSGHKIKRRFPFQMNLVSPFYNFSRRNIPCAC